MLYRYDLLTVDVKYVDNEILPVSCETIPVWSAVNGNIYYLWMRVLPVVGSVSVVSSSTSSSILTLFAALLSSKTNHV